MKRLRIAMIGAGTGRGQLWMSTLRKLTECSDLYEFCALCEVNPDRARENEERWRVPGYTDLRELLDKAQPDVVLNGICSDGNSMVVGLAAKHGVHSLTEIPIAPSLRGADFMIGITRQHGVKLEVTEQVFLWAHEQLKRKIIAAGLIGEITHCRLWYTNKAVYHGFNAVRMLVGRDVKRVFGYGGRVPVPPFVSYEGDRITEDVWHAGIFEFENGVVCLFEDPPRGRMIPRWDIEGSKGQIVGNDLYIGSLSEFERFPFQFEYTTVDGEKVLDHVRVDTDPPVVFENPYKAFRAADTDEVARMELLTGFHRAVTTGADPVYGPENARKELELCIALQESAIRGGEWLELPLSGPVEFENQLNAEFRRMYGYDQEEVEALANVPFRRGGVRYKIAGWD